MQVSWVAEVLGLGQGLQVERLGVETVVVLGLVGIGLGHVYLHIRISRGPP